MKCCHVGVLMPGCLGCEIYELQRKVERVQAKHDHMRETLQQMVAQGPFRSTCDACNDHETLLRGRQPELFSATT